MSLGSDEYVSQTYVPWVDFWIVKGASSGNPSRGDSLTRKNGRPARLLSFEHTIQASGAYGGGTSTWKIELFDEEWTAVELDLFTEVPEEDEEGDEIRQCEFRYFYVKKDGTIAESTKSGLFQGAVTACVPTFTTHGVQLSIEGAELPFTAEKRTNVRYYKEDGWWSKSTMRIDKIVKKLIEDNPRWVEGDIEKTKSILDINDFWVADVAEATYNNERMPVQQFIKKVLAPRAISDLTGKGDYKWYPEPNGDGTYTCHFKPENKGTEDIAAQPVVRSFTYIRGDKNTEVVSFSPEIEGQALSAMKGGNKIAINYYEHITKRTGTVEIDDESTPEKSIYNKKGQKHHDKDPDAQSRMLYKPSRTEKEAEAIAKGWYYSHWVRNYQATLEIIGDSRIKTQDIVRVFVVLPGGELHYTSGAYIVIEVTHKISPGVWLTSMELGRGTAAEGYTVTGDEVNWGQ